MRPLSAYDPVAPPERVRDGETARLRTAATLAWLALTPGVAFVRQRSNFILGWRAAASAGAALAHGQNAGAIGVADRPALGSWMMLPDLTTPATRTVLPMNDSLYGAAHLELDRHGPVVLTLPADDTGRYYSLTVLDAHWNNVAHLGPRWTGRGRRQVLLVPPGWAGAVPDGMALVECPTVSVCLLHRALVRYVPGDIEQVRRWRDGFTIEPLDADAPDAVGDDLVHGDVNGLTDPWRFLALGFEHTARNPLPAPAGWALELARADELLAARLDPGLRAAVEQGVVDAQAIVDATLTTWPRRNGWMVAEPDIGLPSPRVLQTAAMELFQVGTNDLAEAAYFFADSDGAGEPLDASGGRVHELRFPADDLPDVHPEGFWSLTMYGPDSFLVPNPIDRYSTRTTRPGFVTGDDGSVTFTISHDLPDGVPEANWLPAPDGPFRLGLRLYYPGPEVVACRWAPPQVVRR